ncbi:hypothetical protein AB0J39_23345, partial [Microbispora sp. NPDC049633]
MTGAAVSPGSGGASPVRATVKARTPMPTAAAQPAVARSRVAGRRRRPATGPSGPPGRRVRAPGTPAGAVRGAAGTGPSGAVAPGRGVSWPGCRLS